MSKLNMPVANHATGFYSDQSIEMILTSLPAKISKTISVMLVGRQHPVVFILNGKIHVCGGYTSSGVTNSVEIYDPILDTWTSGSPMLEKRSSHTSDIINGIVYVAGGLNDSFVHDSIETFNPSSGVWSKKNNMSISRCGHVSFVHNNELYVCGGMPAFGYDRLATMEKYNPGSDTWSPKASMMKALTTHKAVKSGTKVYISGGDSHESWYIKDTYIYDCILDTWTRGSDLNQARADHTMSIVDGKIHVMGGYCDGGVAYNVEFMDSTSGTWSVIPDLYTPRQLAATGDIVYNDTLYITGGWSSSTPYSDMVTTFKNGSFSNSHDVEIKPTIRYTIDGTEPTINSNLYSNPFIAAIPSIIKAKSILGGFIDSDTLIVSLENTIKEIINFDPSILFSNNGVLSNVDIFTRKDLSLKSEYNVMKDFTSQKCAIMKDEMIMGMKSMSDNEVLPLQDMSDYIVSSEWYVLVLDKSDISEGIDRSPKHDLNTVGRCDIGIHGIFLPYTNNRLIYKFNAGPKGVTLLQKLNLKLAMDDSDFQGRYTFKTFSIFKLSDFEKYIINDFSKIKLNIDDLNLKSDDSVLKNDALMNFKTTINKCVLECIHQYLPHHESLYTKTVFTHRIKNDEYMTEISCKFYSDASKNNFLFEDVMYTDSFNIDQPTTGYIDMEVISGLSIKDILSSIVSEETVNDRFGEHTRFILEMDTSEKFKVNKFNKASIPPKSKTSRESLKLTTITNDVSGIDNTSVFFSGGGSTTRLLADPIDVEYNDVKVVSPDVQANTYHKNNPQPFIFKNNVMEKTAKTPGSITDTFDTYREFFYETIDKTYVPNVNESHEWFRLYGVNKEDAIKNVFAIRRKDKNSMIIVNGIPIQYTKFRLVEYLEHEYIVVDNEADITSLGELHVYNFSTYPSDAALYIHKDGTVDSISLDGYCIGDYSEILTFGKGVHYIPDNFTSIGRNYLVVNDADKIKYYPKEVIYHNKIVIIEDDTKVHVPVKRSYSMYESVMKLLYTKIGQNISEWNMVLDSIDDDIQLMTEFTSNLKFSPDINKLIYIEEQPFYSDIDVFIRNALSEQYSFVFEEKDLNIINNPDTASFGKMYTPKILIPVRETTKNILVFMNDKLFKVNPERIDEHHLVLDIRDVYSLKEYSVTNEFEDILRWYDSNKTNNVFEVKLYDESDVILENTFTKDNDNFVPIPLNLVDRNFEVYIDGMYAGTHDDCVLYDYHNMDGFYMTEGTTINTKLGLLVNTLNDNRPNIPVLFMKKTSKKYEYSSGSKVVVICTKDPVRAMKVPISDGLVYVHDGIWDDTEFFYSTGTRLMHSDYEQLSSHVIYIKNDFDGFIIIKSRHSYYNKDIIISPDYSISLMETLELEMTPKVINDTLFEMSDDEFDAYCYVVSIAMYLMKNGLSNNSDDFGNIRLWTTVLQSSPLSISGTVNGLNVSMNDIMIQKSMTELGYIKVVAKISPYVYLEPKEVDDTYMNNLYFYHKVSYILSLYFGEYLSQHKVNKFDISLFDDPTIPNNLVLDVKGEYLSKYNAIFGKVTSVPTFNNLDVTGSLYDIFTLYEVTDRVPVPYGILPIDSFGGSGQKVVDPEARRLSSFRGNLSVPSNSTITSYLRGKISVYYI